MRAKNTLRNAGLLAASSVVALALAALPVAPGLDAGFAGLKAAQAKGNGGNGNGGGKGNANGHSKGADVSGATLDAHDKNTGGHAKGKGNGHSTGLSAEDSELDAETHGLTTSSMKGLNAAHASIQGFAHANDDSMVGAIRSAVEAAFAAAGSDDEPEIGMIGTLDPNNEINDEEFAQALAGILGVEDPVANPASTDVVNAVKGLVDDKVEVP